MLDFVQKFGLSRFHYNNKDTDIILKQHFLIQYDLNLVAYIVCINMHTSVKATWRLSSQQRHGWLHIPEIDAQRTGLLHLLAAYMYVIWVLHRWLT